MICPRFLKSEYTMLVGWTAGNQGENTPTRVNLISTVRANKTSNDLLGHESRNDSSNHPGSLVLGCRANLSNSSHHHRETLTFTLGYSKSPNATQIWVNGPEYLRKAFIRTGTTCRRHTPFWGAKSSCWADRTPQVTEGYEALQGLWITNQAHGRPTKSHWLKSADVGI